MLAGANRNGIGGKKTQELLLQEAKACISRFGRAV
jgi:hypothetical protein